MNGRIVVLAGLLIAAPYVAPAQLILDKPEMAGLSGFRAHWDQPIPVAEDGVRLLKDAVVKDRGQTAVWDGVKPGPLAFDAVHRSLLVRFPDAAEKIAAAAAAGQTVAKVELVLPYLDEEIWPPGRTDFPSPDGYRYRTNWDCDKLYRRNRPNWHVLAYALRKPWQSPTYNAASEGVFWKRFGASDTNEDRFATAFGPVEVSSYKPEGRLDVTAVLTNAAYGKSLAERLQVLAECGFVLTKQEVYDTRYYQDAYEWAISTGPRAILIKQPKLEVTLAPGKIERIVLAEKRKVQPDGAPTAVVPSAEQVANLNEKFMTKPAWMPDWQFQHVRQLMSLETSGQVKPFYYRVAPEYVVQDVVSRLSRQGNKKLNPPQAEVDYAVYLAWLDWVNGRPPRYWEGHLTAANNIAEWYNFREAMPAPVQESVIRCWTAWLMPDRETAMTDKERKDFGDTSGKLIHPMADDPRVGFSDGKAAEWNQGDTYYKTTGDWRGNKSYYRSGFTRMMSTANFNSSATSGALLNGQIIASERAIADGQAGLMKFPFWMWTYSAGVGQEFIDHYYWSIATAGNKLFADFCEQPQDRMAGWSIMEKTVNDLAIAYHPNLKKLLGPASRTYYEHVLGEQDGLYHILHVLSQRGALTDTESGTLPALTSATTKRPISAWGHDYPPAAVALNSMTGPWAEPWMTEWIDEKPLPWYSLVEKKVLAEGDWVTTYFGENYGLTSIRRTPQRIHVLGQWRRKAELPASMRAIGTLDLRIGFNETQIANDGEGIITAQGKYRTYQFRNQLIMLAQPNVDVIVQQAAAHPFGQGKVSAQEIKSVQCTAALFNYEQPAPTWEVFVADRKVEALPAAAKFGQVITIHDGVSYLAIRPLPTDDFGRDAEITLGAGQPQTQAYHEFSNIQPALLINAQFYKRGTAIPKDALTKLKDARSGFVVEMGDEKEYGSFAKFQAHVRTVTLATANGTVTYRSGSDTLAASWDTFSVNGQDPGASASGKLLCQDTTLSQMGKSGLEKNGAVIERGKRHPELAMFLQTFPKQKLYVALNPLPNYLDYTFREPGGVKIVADGPCSMGYWAVKDSHEIAIKYHAFGGNYLPKDQAQAPATVLLITGAKQKPQVTFNGKEALLKPWKDGWLVSMTGEFPKDEEIAARLTKIWAN